MKKFLSIVMVAVISVCLFAGCNKQLIDVTYSFKKAILRTADGEIITGAVDSWKDYDGDQIQVKINGITYLVHSSQVTLISD